MFKVANRTVRRLWAAFASARTSDALCVCIDRGLGRVIGSWWSATVSCKGCGETTFRTHGPLCCVCRTESEARILALLASMRGNTPIPYQLTALGRAVADPGPIRLEPRQDSPFELLEDGAIGIVPGWFRRGQS